MGVGTLPNLGVRSMGTPPLAGLISAHGLPDQFALCLDDSPAMLSDPHAPSASTLDLGGADKRKYHHHQQQQLYYLHALFPLRMHKGM